VIDLVIYLVIDFVIYPRAGLIRCAVAGLSANRS